MTEADETVMIEAHGIRKDFPSAAGNLAVLDEVTLTVRRGESVAVMGPSGSGKSTLLHILGTLDTPTAGVVTIAGRRPFELNETELADFRNRELGFVFQDHALLPQCTALENVLIPTLARRGGDRRAIAQRAADLLRRVGLGPRIDARPAELSGGERQRVAIARALVNAPKILLCDEPTGNLDAATGEKIGALFVDLQKSERVALVVVTHNEEFASLFDRVAHLRDGVLRFAKDAAPKASPLRLRAQLRLRARAQARKFKP